MFTAGYYKSQADDAFEMAQNSRVRHVRRGYIERYVYLSGMAFMAERRGRDHETPDGSAHNEHDRTVRQYRLELATAPAGMGRSKLQTLLARMKMAAEEHGWPETS